MKIINKFMPSKYQEEQRILQSELISSSMLFEGVVGGVIYRGKERPFILKDSDKNLHKGIRKTAKEYFKENHITWWGGGKDVIGHVLSSQVACINHLFPLRNNNAALCKMLNEVLGLEIERMLPIPEWLDKKESKEHYIAFEAISRYDHLNEDKENKGLTRGSNCTSIDALMIAKMEDGSVMLLPIEWKYTEAYNNEDKSNKDRKYKDEELNKKEKGKNGKGIERVNRYSSLIDESEILKSEKNYFGSFYFQEPFYQLMRQTLWAERVIKIEPNEWYGATKCLHLHIIPSANKDLLNRNYRRFPWMNGLKESWESKLVDKSEYRIIDPKDLLSPVIDESLKKYLCQRYWQ
ncbi:MAG: hypothetical protein Q3994_05295 [Prevotella sp.]|nr:hypothetical protein [Prevotella sp.]